MNLRRHIMGLHGTSPRLAVAIEAACLAPVVALVTLALVSWAGDVWQARQVQQVANIALAAAVAETEAGVRELRARAAAEKALSTRLKLPPRALHLSVETRSRQLTVLIVCDARRRGQAALGWLRPKGPATIIREASAALDAV